MQTTDRTAARVGLDVHRRVQHGNASERGGDDRLAYVISKEGDGVPSRSRGAFGVVEEGRVAAMRPAP